MRERNYFDEYVYIHSIRKGVDVAEPFLELPSRLRLSRDLQHSILSRQIHRHLNLRDFLPFTFHNADVSIQEYKDRTFLV